MKHIAWVIIILCTAVWIADGLYDYIFLNTSARDKAQLAVKQKHGHVDYLFLGNSRVENYIDCSIIEKTTGKSCENYGMSGSSYQDAYVLLSLLKENGLTYSNLFIQLDPSIKNESLTKSFKASLVPFIEQENFELDAVDLKLTWSEDKLPFYKYAKYDYLYGIRACFAQLYKNQSKDVRFGFVPQNHTGSSYASRIEITKLENKYINLMRDDANEVKANVFFYTSPYCPEMINTIAFDKFKNVYTDYVNYAAHYNNSEYFANCTHMNETGAQIFSSQLIKDFNL